MSRAVAALLATLAAIGRGVGVEGAFLIAGAVLLGIGASYFHPAGPYLVTGSLAIVIGIALAVPARSR